ncbi:relaxase domain-containing protein [Streptomyces sp. NBC_00250]|uniref:relaxase domain-containing protein n=1 Tax=Streptomyces sp. NBC_00250 TaxID=2903641 RepID=UPI003FA6BBFD
MRYLFRGVMVGDGRRPAGKSLRAAQEEAGVPPGVWKGQGLAAVGLTAGDVVTERQAELLLGEGRHPDADGIERALMEEVSARLGWAWEPRDVTPGRRPVMEIAGIDRRLIGWQSTRRQQIEDALPVLTAKYEDRQGHPPGERAAYALACQATDQTRRPKHKELRSLPELRAAWRDSAARAYGADVVARLAERARAAAAAIWVRVRPIVDITWPPPGPSPWST